MPDRELNPKFGHKLDFLAELTDWFAQTRAAGRPAILVGDLNVAPLETDVWSHRQLLKVVSHTPVEVAALGALQASQRLGRRGAPLRAAGRAALHLVELSRARLVGERPRPPARPHLGDAATCRRALLAARVMRAARGWPQPSDHVPVTVDLETADGNVRGCALRLSANRRERGRIPLFDGRQTEYLIDHRACWSRCPMVSRRPPQMSEPYRTGVSALVKWYNPTKGFGFVQPEDGSPDAFLHASLVAQAGHDDLPEGTALVCDIAEGPRGPQVAAIQSVSRRASL